MVAKGEVFDGCVMILYTILGVRPYTAIWENGKDVDTVGNKTIWMFGSFGLCIEYIF